MASNVIPATSADADVKGFDIGTGANCIYPLLGASLLGWKFVGSGSVFFYLLFFIIVFYNVLWVPMLKKAIFLPFVRYY